MVASTDDFVFMYMCKLPQILAAGRPIPDTQPHSPVHKHVCVKLKGVCRPPHCQTAFPYMYPQLSQGSK